MKVRFYRCWRYVFVVSNEEKQAADLQIKETQKQIDYDTKDFTIELLVDKFKKKDFFIPSYQRNFVWQPKNKTLFLESDNGNPEIQTVDNTRFYKIMKSNFLLMLYNLVEACIVSGMMEIYEDLKMIIVHIIK